MKTRVVVSAFALGLFVPAVSHAIVDLGTLGPLPKRSPRQSTLEAAVPAEGLPFLPTGKAALVPTDLPTIDKICRKFLSANVEHFPLTPQELKLDTKRSFNYGARHEMWVLNYKQILQPSGTEVLESQVTFRVKFGKLLQIEQTIFPDVDVSFQASLTPAQTKRVAQADLGFQSDLDTVHGEETLFVYPVNHGGGETAYHLVRRYTVVKSRPYGRFVVYVDARNGKVVERYSDFHYLKSRLLAPLRPRLPKDDLVQKALPHLKVSLNGQSIGTTAADGSFTTNSSSGTLQFRLEGSFVTTARCEKTKIDLLSIIIPDLPGGTSCDSEMSQFSVPLKEGTVVASTPSSVAERSTYHHLNGIRGYALGHFQALNLSVPWLNESLPSNTDIAMMSFTLGGIDIGMEQPAACNAFWDGTSVNFFAAGSIEDPNRGLSATCSNTGEIADVVYHEWGHGLDQNTHGGEIPDFAKSEAIGDIAAFHITGDPIVGPGFFTKPPRAGGPDYVREVETNRVYPDDVPEADPQTGKPEPHLESLIFSSTWWDLREALVEQYGETKGNEVSARLFFCHLPASRQYTASYNSVLFCDDDNGDLADGTPHSAAIEQVFTAHGLAQ